MTTALIITGIILLICFIAAVILILSVSGNDEIKPELEKQMKECDQYTYDHQLDNQ